MSINQGFPSPSAPLVQNGQVTLPWLNLFRALWNRTGNSNGIPYPGDASAVTLTASPMTYTAAENGQMVITGPGITKLTLTRKTVTANLSGFYSPVRMTAGDILTINYVGTPTLTWIPL